MGILTKAKERWEEHRIEKGREKLYRKQAKKDAKAAYMAEKYKQDQRIAKEKARAEADAKLKAYKASLKPQTSRGGSGRGIAYGMMGASQGVLDFLGGQPQQMPSQRRPARKGTTRRRRKTKKKRKSRKASVPRNISPPNTNLGFGF